MDCINIDLWVWKLYAEISRGVLKSLTMEVLRREV